MRNPNDKISIYYLYNEVTNEIFYIGQTSVSLGERLIRHGYHTKNKLLRKYINSNLESINIALIEECTGENCYQKERYWIDVFSMFGHGLLNITYTPKKHELKKNRVTTDIPKRVSVENNMLLR